MRLVIEQAALHKALARVVGVVEARNTIAILNNVLIAPGDREGAVRFVATDLDIEAVASVPVASADFDGLPGVTVPARTLSDIARNAPSGCEVALEWRPKTDPRCVVAFGRSRYQLPVLPAGDFPSMAPLRPEWTLLVDARALARMIDETAFAQSTEAARYYLNGTYLHVTSDQGRPLLRLVATDGHRLALSQIDFPAEAAFPGLIVPRKTIAAWRAALDTLNGDAEIVASSTLVRLSAGASVLTSKVLDGAFPDYVRVVPRDKANPVAFDRGDMLSAVRRTVLVSSERSRSMKLSVSAGKVAVAVRNMEAGAAVEEIEVDYDGPEFEVGFNGAYVASALAQAEVETMTLSGADPASPFRMEPADGETGAGDVLCVLMPLRV